MTVLDHGINEEWLDQQKGQAAKSMYGKNAPFPQESNDSNVQGNQKRENIIGGLIDQQGIFRPKGQAPKDPVCEGKNDENKNKPTATETPAQEYSDDQNRIRIECV